MQITSVTLQNWAQSPGNQGKEAENKWDFNLDLKVGREFDDVTSAGESISCCNDRKRPVANT